LIDQEVAVKFYVATIGTLLVIGGVMLGGCATSPITPSITGVQPGHSDSGSASPADFSSSPPARRDQVETP
jgi:hypothetical protein